MGNDEGVIGALVVAFDILLVLPPMFLMMLGAASAVIGWAAKDDAEQRYAGSELVDLNR